MKRRHFRGFIEDLQREGLDVKKKTPCRKLQRGKRTEAGVCQDVQRRKKACQSEVLCKKRGRRPKKESVSGGNNREGRHTTVDAHLWFGPILAREGSYWNEGSI